MLTQWIVVVGVLALLALHAAGQRGRAALDLLARSGWLLGLPLVLWALVWALHVNDLGALDEPFLVVRELGLFISGTVVLLAALHITASCLALLTLAARAGLGPVGVGGLLAGLVLGQAVLWGVMLGAIRLAVELRIQSMGEMFALLAALCAALVALNWLLARLVVFLLATGGRLGQALSWMVHAPSGHGVAMLLPVVLRLLVTGAIVLVWISGYVSTTHAEGTTTKTTRSVANLAIDVQTVATVTCDNPWPRKVLEQIEEHPAPAVQRALDLVTAYLALYFLAVFVAAYVGREPSRAPPRPHEGERPLE